MLDTQTTYPRLPEEALDLDLAAADTRRFVPVELCRFDAAIYESDPSEALSLPPPTASVHSNEAAVAPNTAASSDRLDVEYRADDVEVHAPQLAACACVERLSNQNSP